MYMVMWLFSDDLLHLVTISFTSLILTELIMVALTIHNWHWVMVISEVVSLLLYFASMFLLSDKGLGKATSNFAIFGSLHPPPLSFSTHALPCVTFRYGVHPDGGVPVEDGADNDGGLPPHVPHQVPPTALQPTLLRQGQLAHPLQRDAAPASTSPTTAAPPPTLGQLRSKKASYRCDISRQGPLPKDVFAFGPGN